MDFLKFPIWIIHCWYTETPLIFVLWSCNLQLCWIHILIFRWIFCDFFSYIESCHLQIEIVLFFSQFGELLFLSNIIALSRNSSIMLNSSDEIRCPSLVPDTNMLPVKSSYVLFIMLRKCSFYSHFAECFNMKWCGILSGPFSTSIKVIM